jgi:hypothetical protein
VADAPFELASLVSAGVLAAGAFAFVSQAVGQAAPPDDEPTPPAFGRPPAAPPPAAPGGRPSAAAQPAPPPAPAPALAPAPPPSEAAPPLRYEHVAPAASLRPRPRREARGSGPAQGRSRFVPAVADRPIGLYHVSTAEVGRSAPSRRAARQFFARRASWLPGDTNTRFSGAFTFGFTPHEAVELFGAITSSSNRNAAPDEPAAPIRS